MKNSKIIALLAIAVLLFSGCTIQGGGLVGNLDRECDHPSNMPAFGIQMMANERDQSGTFVYTDKEAFIKLHGDIVCAWIEEDPCGYGGSAGFVEGEYTNRWGDTGTCSIVVYDSYETGQYKGEWFCIRIHSGPHAGYHRSGPMVRGNYTVDEGVFLDQE